MTIVGVSGSPIVGGNTDRIVRALLEGSGKDHVFVNLSTLNYVPCRACAHLCASTNLCPLADDLQPYFEPIRDAEALVLGSPVHHGDVSGWLYSFMTRLWCFSHVERLLMGKPVVLVTVGCFEGSGERAVPEIRQLVSRRTGRTRIIGDIFFNSTIPPCYKCGRGNVCHIGGLWHMVGRDEERLRAFQLEPEHFRRWEDCPETVAQVEACGRLLANIG